jgi:hypothetical protein
LKNVSVHNNGLTKRSPVAKRLPSSTSFAFSQNFHNARYQFISTLGARTGFVVGFGEGGFVVGFGVCGLFGFGVGGLVVGSGVGGLVVGRGVVGTGVGNTGGRSQGESGVTSGLVWAETGAGERRGQVLVWAVLELEIGRTGAGVGKTGAGVGTTGAGVGNTGAGVGRTGAGVGNTGAGVGRTGAGVGKHWSRSRKDRCWSWQHWSRSRKDRCRSGHNMEPE